MSRDGNRQLHISLVQKEPGHGSFESVIGGRCVTRYVQLGSRHAYLTLCQSLPGE